MKCPYCGKNRSKVIDTRLTDDNLAVRRRRECEDCKRRYTTYEKADVTPIFVIKKNGTRERFNIDKIKIGLIKACEKRPVSAEKIETLAADIERNIYNSSAQEVYSQKIGELVMEGLRDLDSVAYVRFASVHRDFSSLDVMEEEIKRIKERANQKD